MPIHTELPYFLQTYILVGAIFATTYTLQRQTTSETPSLNNSTILLTLGRVRGRGAVVAKSGRSVISTFAIECVQAVTVVAL